MLMESQPTSHWFINFITNKSESFSRVFLLDSFALRTARLQIFFFGKVRTQEVHDYFKLPPSIAA